MKTSKNITTRTVMFCVLWVFLLTLQPLSAAAQELILDYAFSENAGFLNASHGIDHNGAPDDAAEAVFVVPDPPDTGYEGYLGGFLWAENIGWVKLGLGTTPYRNTDTASWGVNVEEDAADGSSDDRAPLSGRAWSETSGWIIFDLPSSSAYDEFRPSLDLATGDLGGYVWAENLGWTRLRGGTYQTSYDLYGLGTPPMIIATGGGGASEGDCQTAFSIELHKPPMRNTGVTVAYTTSPGTALGDTGCSGTGDYITTSGTASISGPGGDQSGTTVDFCSDRRQEGDETFNFNLSNARITYGTIEIILPIDTATAAAVIENDDYLLDVSVVSDGSVTSTGLTGSPGCTYEASAGSIDCPDGSCSGVYNQGETVTLFADPDDGFAFLGWSGDCAGSGVNCLVSIDGPKHATATFDSDRDGDGVPDSLDNCPDDPNPDQRDSDGNGEGDACSLDDDGDGIPDLLDNCPLVPNSDQVDLNMNGTGDACEIHLLDTGQITCYDDLGSEIVCPVLGDSLDPFEGQDANYPPDAPAFDPPADGMVVDGSRNLTWQQAVGAHTTWSAARDLCDASTLGDHDDWRLPTRQELVSIVDHGQSPTIDPAFFSVASGPYWTADRYAPTGEVWSVDFSSGAPALAVPTGSRYVRCVRGAPFSFGRFTDNGNGTVSDTRNELMWQQQTSNFTYNWFFASGTADAGINPGGVVSICGNLTLGDYGDWRLPSSKELISLMDYGVHSPAANLALFPGSKNAFYWTDDAVAVPFFGDSAWGVNARYGSFLPLDKLSDYHVRCVRGYPLAFNEFEEKTPETYRDQGTDLVWQKNYGDSADGLSSGVTWADGDTLDWENALTYCENLDLDGKLDWRLPNMKELESIADLASPDTALPDPFTVGSWHSFWSSTTDAANKDDDGEGRAWGVHFGYGYSLTFLKGDANAVRCVRGGFDAVLGVVIVGRDRVDGSPVDVNYGRVTSTPGLIDCSINPVSTVCSDTFGVLDPPDVLLTADAMRPDPVTPPYDAGPGDIPSVFDGWSGGGCDDAEHGATGGDCLVTVTEDVIVEAFFDLDTDLDADNVWDSEDNCPGNYNPYLVDTDDDGEFDAQVDTDEDGIGDVCEMRLPDTGQTDTFTFTFGEDSDYTINPPSFRGVALLTAGTISFADSNPDRIIDSASGLASAGFVVGGRVFVSGSAFNDGVYTIASVEPGVLTLVDGDELTAESEGAGVILANGLSGIVLDNNTHRMWQAVDDGQDYNWYQAVGISNAFNPGGLVDVCGDLALGGFDDWRVPTRSELLSITDYGYDNPAIDSNLFPDTSGVNYWTASDYPGDGSVAVDAWAVNFEGGESAFSSKSDFYRVRCVRGEELAYGDLALDEGGTPGAGMDDRVIDGATGLEWQLQDSSADWEGALAHCESLELTNTVMTDVTTLSFNDSDPDTLVDSAAGFLAAGLRVGDMIQVSGSTGGQNDGTYAIAMVVDDTITLSPGALLTDEAEGEAITLRVIHGDWRLPNARELGSLIDGTRPLGDPAIDTGLFPDVTSTGSWEYWTSTTKPANDVNAYSVNFDGGIVESLALKTEEKNVRCLRGGRAGSVGEADLALALAGSTGEVVCSDPGCGSPLPGKESVTLTATVTNNGPREALEILVEYALPEVTTAVIDGLDISFDDNEPFPDTISVSGGGLLAAGFLAGERMSVVGSLGNDGVYTIASLTDDTIILTAGDSLVDGAAGPDVSLSAFGPARVESWGNALGTCVQDDGTVTCDIPALASGAYASVEVTLLPPAVVGYFTTGAEVSSNTNDEEEGNNADQVTTWAGLERNTLTLMLPGTGSGSVTSAPAGIDCGSNCEEEYDLGTVVTLTRTTDALSVFGGWSGGGCSGRGPDCVITLLEDTVVRATFLLDSDDDGMPDVLDNCDYDVNPGQADLDGDGLGDVCDDDLDGDGVADAGGSPCDSGQAGNCYDNCRYLYNPDQADTDDDGTGDACEVRLADTGQVTCYDGSGAVIACPGEGAAFFGQDASYEINPPSFSAAAYLSADTISFEDADPDTITDSAAGFRAAGFQPGDVITVYGSLGAANDGTYTVAEVTDDTITLADGDALSNESAGEVVTLTNAAVYRASSISFFADTDPDVIIDDDCGFVAAGFAAGDTLLVSSSIDKANDGEYSIAAISACVLTLAEEDELVPGPFGSSLTSDTISFHDSDPDRIVSGAGGFLTAGFLPGESIHVYGTLYNDGMYTIESLVDDTVTLVSEDSLLDEAAGEPVTLTERAFMSGTTISFSDKDPAADTISDSLNGFSEAGFRNGEHLSVEGSALNDGRYVVASVSSSKLTLEEGQELADEGAGATVTLTELPLVTMLSLGNGTVTDNNTHLVWQRSDDGETHSAAAAVSLCDDLVLGGYDDWQVPTKDELLGIADYGTSGPAVDDVFFPGTMTERYWTDTEHPDRGVFTVDFGNGSSVSVAAPGEEHYVRCVRDIHRLSYRQYTPDTEALTDDATGLTWQLGLPGPVARSSDISFENSSSTVNLPTGDFIATGFRVGNVIQVFGSAGNDGIYTVDLLSPTSLQLSPTPADETAGSDITIVRLRTWAEALAYCEGLDLAASDRWRLPNIRELASIANSSASPSIGTDPGEFPVNTPLVDYWSSTSADAGAGNAWTVEYSAGLVTSTATSGHHVVKCVQGGHSGSIGDADVSVALIGEIRDPCITLEDVTYTFTVTNHGPLPATGVVLYDLLPEMVTASLTSAEFRFIAADPAVITFEDGGDFTTAGFQAGDTVAVSGSLSNDGSYVIDTVATDTITLAPGETLTNENPGETVSLSATGPVRLASWVNPKGGCGQAGVLVSCDMGAFAPAETVDVEMVITAPAAAGEMTGIVSVATVTHDPDTGNNTVSVTTLVRADPDGDGIPDDDTGEPVCDTGQTEGCYDNCPGEANADQTDTDDDGLGDVCDPDDDDDGILDVDDNCTLVANENQLDTDGDGSGDVCDDNDDDDSVLDVDDNCSLVTNENQVDTDDDGRGDACEVLLPDTGQTTCYDAAGAILDPCPGEADPFFGQDAHYDSYPPAYPPHYIGEADLAAATISFNDNDPYPDSIVTSGGEFVAEGFKAGGAIFVSGSLANDGWYVVAQVTSDTITLVSWNELTNEDAGEMVTLLTPYDIVVDANTRLVWQKQGDGLYRTRADAEAYCDSLDLGAYPGGTLADWRLPSKKELLGIVDFGTSNPAADTGVFTATEPAQYWTATYEPGNAGFAWAVDFFMGHADGKDVIDPALVRCVRGVPLDFPMMDSDVTVEDRGTGLYWQAGDVQNAAGRTWEAALAYCEALEEASFDDWRLPNVRELESIARDDLPGTAVDPAFTGGLEEIYWSSTTSGSARTYAWTVSFADGDVINRNKAQELFVRCVRGGEGGAIGNSDLSVTFLSDLPDPVTSGRNLSFLINIANEGPHDGHGVTVAVELPYGSTFNTGSWIFSVGGGAAFGPCDEEGGIVTCDIGDVLAGEEVEISVDTLAPVTEGIILTTARVSCDTNDAVDANNQETIETTVIVPDLSVDPTSHDFGLVWVGMASPPVIFTITNDSAADAELDIYDVRIVGTDGLDFDLVSDLCTGNTVLQGASCTVQVVFEPLTGAEPGIDDKAADLRIYSNDPDAYPLYVPLTGQGDDDPDGDGIIYGQDNCVPGVSDPPWGFFNPDQSDLDADGLGDVCDNCYLIFNPGQEDYDDNGIGDLCGVVDLPKTGQQTSWLPGDDGEMRMGVPWPSPRFTNPDGTSPVSEPVVLDTLTGLMWLRDANCIRSKYPTYFENTHGKVVWLHARKFVLKMNDGSFSECNAGYTDWRLPNVNELESLVNANESNSAPWLNEQGFAGVLNIYWSSTLLEKNRNRAWYVKSSSGTVSSRSRLKQLGVWPVRGDSGYPAQMWKSGQTVSSITWDDGDLQAGAVWPAPRFVPMADSTVKDELTGLFWSGSAGTPGPPECGPGVAMGWKKAMKYIGCLNDAAYLGRTDWRLPNRKELRSLVNYGQTDNAAWLGSEGFVDLEHEFYWTSSTCVKDVTKAWAMLMQRGILAPRLKAASESKFWVWPVRGGISLQ